MNTELRTTLTQLLSTCVVNMPHLIPITRRCDASERVVDGTRLEMLTAQGIATRIVETIDDRGEQLADAC